MTDREKLAREWAVSVTQTESISPGFTHKDMLAAAEYILDTTTPPTMADVEWDDKEHYLAGAVCEVEGAREVVVMVSPRHDGQILCLNAEVSGAWLTPLPSDLTPNGKRYELREVTVSSNETVGSDQPDHPEVLTTVEDYQNAPEGTVVAHKDCRPWTKDKFGDWLLARGTNSRMNYHMADSKRTVLRWGGEA